MASASRCPRQGLRAEANEQTSCALKYSIGAMLLHAKCHDRHESALAVIRTHLLCSRQCLDRTWGGADCYTCTSSSQQGLFR